MIPRVTLEWKNKKTREKLEKHVIMFIKCYYAISPTIVKWFGGNQWFRNFWKPVLNRMVNKLQEKGYESTAYKDNNEG